jgi:hypothetical protein
MFRIDLRPWLEEVEQGAAESAGKQLVADGGEMQACAAEGAPEALSGHDWLPPTDTVSEEEIQRAVEEVQTAEFAYPGAAALTEALVREFPTVFAPPSKMPPKRAYDHVIDSRADAEDAKDTAAQLGGDANYQGVVARHGEQGLDAAFKVAFWCARVLARLRST